MKFKKVEVSAFRIYNKPSDAIFDFTINTGEPADFISIYAPNGFGKTSFYDAVEWGVTNNIQRFWQNEAITIEAISALRWINEEKQLKLLRNRNASDDIETSVKIVTDSILFPERTFNVHGNSSSDIKSSGEFENRDFQRVILSQEWISAFLKEDKGDNRYEKFMKNPELSGLDIYYKKIKAVVATCERYMSDLSDNITNLKKRIVVLEDADLLEKVNATILSLNQSGEILDLITITTTDKEVLDFNDQISERIMDLEKREASLKLLISNIGSARTGNENICGIDLYFQNLKSFSDLIIEEDRVNKLLHRFAELEKLKNEYNAKLELKAKAIDSLNEAGLLLKSYDEYERIYKLIKEKESIISNIQNQLNTLLQENLVKKNSQSDLQNKLESNFKQLADANNTKETVPGIKSRFEKINADINLLDNDLRKLDSEKITKTQSYARFDAYIENYKKFLAAIEGQNYSYPIPDDLQLKPNVLDKLSALRRDISEIQQELLRIDSNLNEQEKFNLSLEEFVARGMEIVNTTKSSSCPLCTQEYDSYSTLANNIMGNKLLSETIQEILKQKTGTQNRVLELEELFKKENDVINDSCNVKIIAAQLEITILKNELQLLDLSIGTKIKSKNELQTSLLDIQSETNGLALNEYELRIDEVIKRLQDERNEYTKSNIDVSAELLQLDEKIGGLQGTKKNTEDDISVNLQDKNYALLINWFSANLETDNEGREILNDRLDEVTNTTNLLNIDIENSNNSINKEESELSQFTKVGLSSEIEILKNRREKLVVTNSVYESFLKDKLSILLQNESKDKLEVLLNEKESKAKTDMKAISLLNSNYSKLTEYGKNLSPFLQSEAAKAEIKDSEDQFKFLEATVKPYIEKERDRIKDFLELKIKNFFYEDLINDIYNKIDPHPDFKGVNFRADFDSDPPRLDVLVTNTKNQQKLIPNLYFSTAQINILSLSIFLASALNAKRYNCIFIDDPIQSMDSINVLSTIDLLRGIVITGKKQIILSTHDENFHDLLKKKMPSELFKSKYLELETFGKVKQ